MTYLDGQRLAAWLEGRSMPTWNQANAFRRWLCRCREGAITKVWTADRYLVALGLNLNEIPDECFVSRGRR